MGRTAYLFPGQGAQAVGMGKALCEESAAARAVFEEADEALSEKLSKTIFEGPDDDLKRTANTQPAILTVSVACLRALQERGGAVPDFVAGHSLGEYSALVAAGALPFADAVRAVRARGTFMQEAVPEGEGAMAAVLGLDAHTIAGLLQDISDPAKESYVAVANENGPGQTVIAGQKVGVDVAARVLKEKGAKRVMPLPVSAPFHCALMKPVQPRLDEVLSSIQLYDLVMPVITNVEARPNREKERVKDLLVQQVVQPVRFTETAVWLLENDVSTFLELGPGKTLVGIIKRMERARTYLNVEDPASLAATAEALG